MEKIWFNYLNNPYLLKVTNYPYSKNWLTNINKTLCHITWYSNIVITFTSKYSSCTCYMETNLITTKYLYQKNVSLFNNSSKIILGFYFSRFISVYEKNIPFVLLDESCRYRVTEPAVNGLSPSAIPFSAKEILTKDVYPLFQSAVRIL